MIILLAFLIFIFGISYGVSRWYMAQHANEPLQIGVTFVADYARSLDLNAEETMDALIHDVGVRRFRLVSYWNKIEAQQGTYDFSELDWQFKKAEAANAEISLAIGLRQPRWPECHEPDWASTLPKDEFQTKLNDFVAAVVSRYRQSPSLKSYQLENEFTLNNFGHCTDFSKERVAAELDLVRKLDPNKPIIISRSNNFPAIITSEPVPDIVGVSVYRKVWDGNFTKRYFTYPLPAWYYGAVAGYQQIFTGKPSMLHELQMEPWPSNGRFVKDVPLHEQDESFSANDFHNRVEFAKNTGLRTIDLWGAEWWYWRLKQGDPAFWDAAKETFRD